MRVGAVLGSLRKGAMPSVTLIAGFVFGLLAFSAALAVHAMDAHRAPGAPHVIP